MGRPRTQLHDLLVTIAPNVYFQPPSTVKMSYPCIVYSIDDVDTKFASNLPYGNTRRYQVTVIDRNPDSTIPAKVESLPMNSFARAFVADGLNHFIYNIYF